MSLYTKELELLSFVDKLKTLNPELKCRFACRCRCEASFPLASPYPVWRVHHFSMAEEARSWIDEHQGHEAYVNVEFEGIQPYHGRGGNSRGGRGADGSGIFPSDARNDLGPSRRGRLTAKLLGLARSTPYSQEADTALRKITELNSMCAAGAAESAAEPARLQQHPQPGAGTQQEAC